MSGWIGRQSDIVHYFWLNWGAAVGWLARRFAKAGIAAKRETKHRGKTANPATRQNADGQTQAPRQNGGLWGDLALRGNAGKAQQGLNNYASAADRRGTLQREAVRRPLPR